MQVRKTLVTCIRHVPGSNYGLEYLRDLLIEVLSWFSFVSAGGCQGSKLRYYKIVFAPKNSFKLTDTVVPFVSRVRFQTIAWFP